MNEATFSMPPDLEAELDELLTHYPQKRSASLMFLHAIQERFGCITPDAMEWTARKLGLEPINIYELVTFYPMFRQEKLGKLIANMLHENQEMQSLCRKHGFELSTASDKYVHAELKL